MADCSVCARKRLKQPMHSYQACGVTVHVCPRCDRIRCSVCDTPDMTGRKPSCCGRPLGLFGGKR